MSDVKKFLFDTHDFDKAKPEKPSVYTEEQIVLAKEQGFAQGKAEGVRETQQQQEERLVSLLQKVVAQVEKLTAEEERREVEMHAAAARLALRVVHKLMPQLAQQHALPEIERAILQSIEARRDEPRIAVTVPAAHIESLKARMDALATEKSYAGKVILVADDGMPQTDCRVEWADGGAERVYERLFAQINNEFGKALSGMEAVLDQSKKQ